MDDIWAGFTGFFKDIGSHMDDILVAIIKIAGIILLAWLAITLLKRFIRRMLRRSRKNKPLSIMVKKAETIESIAGSAAKYIVWFLSVAAILGVLGLGSAVGSLLATAGIGGIAIAFGAQSLVKDVVSGFFMLMENQYSVGEYIEVDGEKGTVEAITIRTTRITRFTGETTTIPNGSITKVTNYSRGDHLAVVDIPVPLEADVEKACDIMLKTGLEYMKRHDNILEDPHVLGIDHFGESDAVLRMIVRVKPLTHWETERALRADIKEAFSKAGLGLPYPRRVVVGE